MAAVLAMVDICWICFCCCRIIFFFLLCVVPWMILLDVREVGGLRSGIGLTSSDSVQGDVYAVVNVSSLLVCTVVGFSLVAFASVLVENEGVL